MALEDGEHVQLVVEYPVDDPIGPEENLPHVFGLDFGNSSAAFEHVHEHEHRPFGPEHGACVSVGKQT